MSETNKPIPSAWLHRLRTLPIAITVWEFVVLTVVSAVLLLYGLVPMFGGAQLGLVGADEPRYAQVAREMLAAHSAGCHEVNAKVFPHSLRPKDLSASYHCLMSGTVTPVLYGQPWLEKPALYYWRAMGFFKEFGVSGWAARLPSASGAFVMILLIYLHMRRFRPGGHLDAALITVSCIGIVAFARGASTDMQLAAPFAIGMLGWYAWYETGKKFWLFDLYFFGAAATLAKGPVAPFMALAIILMFAGLRREWSLLRRTIWWPGIALYLAMVLPWYIAVQRRNPSFYRQFFLEHNLQRFATNRYQHHQPFWYYVLVLLLATMPWTVMAIRALVDSIDISIAEWKARHRPQRYLGHTRAGDAFPEFLVLWALFPVLFFSFSGSKLPGYILPSIPPLTILTADYIHRFRREGIPNWLLWAHGLTAGVMTFVVLLCPQYMVYEKMVPQGKAIALAAVSGIAVTGLIIVIVKRYGLIRMRIATLIPVVMLLFFLMHFNGWLLDANYSARPLAEKIEKAAPGQRVLAVEGVKRDMDYGLAFYRNEPLVHYDTDGVPRGEHVLVVKAGDTATLNHWLQGRIYEPLFLWQWQGLEVYRVYPSQ